VRLDDLAVDTNPSLVAVHLRSSERGVLSPAKA
jgi:hypothetical protein